MKKKKSSSKIFIGIPSYKGIWLYPFRQALAETTVLLEDYTGNKVTLSIAEGNCYVQVARNKLARDFLKSDADYWLSLDDDVVWKPKELVKFLKTVEKVNEKRVDAGFSSGVYPFKEGKGQFPVTILQDIKTKKPIYHKSSNHKLLKAYGSGMGMSLFHRSLLEKIKKGAPHLAYVTYKQKGIGVTEKDWFDFFPQGVYNGIWYGEDFAFCKLVRDVAKEDVWIYPDMTLKHYKNQTWSREGNFRKALIELYKYNKKTRSVKKNDRKKK